MPTIQFRTDDQTKNASTVLFNRLGITMSEAINIFLRQSIMRGGIPFPLQVPRDYTDDSEIWNNAAFLDALRRYKSVNNNIDFDVAKAEPFFKSLAELDILTEPHITLYEDAIKVRININGKEFTIDYNFDEPEMVFILSRKNGKLIVKDCGLLNIKNTLELF